MASIQAILILQIVLCKGWIILAVTLQADDPSCFCIWGEWGPWSTCTRNGRQSRARSINEEESCNGLACTGTPPREYIQCTRDSCLGKETHFFDCWLILLRIDKKSVLFLCIHQCVFARGSENSWIRQFKYKTISFHD